PRQLRTHPLGELVLEVGDRAGQEHRVQHPAEQQADPGVQAGHRLAQPGRGFLLPTAHGAVAASDCTDQAASASGTATTSRPLHARHALRASNTQITATAYTRKLACMPVSTACGRSSGRASAATLASAASP